MRAELADMRAEHLAQGPVNQVRSGVVPADCPAPGEFDLQGGGGARGGGNGTSSQLVEVTAGLVLEAVDQLKLLAADQGVAGISDLATHLPVEWSLVEYEEGVLLGPHDVNQRGVHGSR